MNRAFHVGGIAWSAALLFAGLTGFSPLIGGLLSALFVGALIVRRKSAPLWMWSAAVAFCAGCISFACCDAFVIAPMLVYENTTQTLRGVVIEAIDYGAYAKIVVRNDGIAGAPGLGGTKVRVTSNEGLEVSVGDVVNYRTRLLVDPQERVSLYAQGLRFEGRLSGTFEKTGTRPNEPAVILAGYREALAKNITRYLPGDEGTTLVGMLLGKTERLPTNLRADYARAGISHLLSVSGLHLAILTALLDCALQGLSLSRRRRGLLKMAAIAAFMGLAGFSASIVRAGLMLLLCTAAELFGRDSDGLNSLGVALILILLVNPYAVFGLSLQLSYLATVGIHVFSAPLTDWACKRLWKRPAYALAESHKQRVLLLRGLFATVCACGLTMPLICWQFGEISIVAPIVNLLVAPLEPIALGCGLLTGFTGFFPPLATVTRVMGLLSGIAVKQINECAVTWARLPFAELPLRSDTVIFLMAAALAVGILLWAGHAPPEQKRYAARLAVPVMLAVSVAHTALWNGAVEIAVSNGGGTVALAYGRQGAVIGVPSSVRAARGIEAFFKSREVDTISLLAARREDELYGNAVMLLKQSFAVENAFGLDTGDGFSAELFGQVTVYATGNSAEFVSIDIGDLRMVKAFKQKTLPADLLVNERNEIITAPAFSPHINRRYFDCAVFSVLPP